MTSPVTALPHGDPDLSFAWPSSLLAALATCMACLPRAAARPLAAAPLVVRCRSPSTLLLLLLLLITIPARADAIRRTPTPRRIAASRSALSEDLRRDDGFLAPNYSAWTCSGVTVHFCPQPRPFLTKFALFLFHVSCCSG